MKIMLIPAKRSLELHEVKNFSGQWHHFIFKTLARMGHEVVFDPGYDVRRHPDEIINHFRTLQQKLAQMPVKVDHIIGISRHFSRIPPECAEMLKPVITGSVTQIHDGPVPDQPTDTVFSIRNDGNKFMRGCTYIGWAADHNVLWPNQNPKALRLLIDHRLYRDGVDHTDHITEQCIRFKREEKWRDYGYEDVVIRRFEDNGVITIEDKIESRPFTRQHVPFVEIAQEYNQAHVFFPTHHESLGLSVMESAMAGALVVTAIGFIPTDRISTVRHILLNPNSDIWWDAVLDNVNPAACRQLAMYQTWDAVVQKIVDWLQAFRR